LGGIPEDPQEEEAKGCSSRECQTTVNPTNDLPTFSNEEGGSGPNMTVGISGPPPITGHTVRFNFLELANKKRAGTATTQELAALQAALDAQQATSEALAAEAAAQATNQTAL
jgi:hypothetical protein